MPAHPTDVLGRRLARVTAASEVPKTVARLLYRFAAARFDEAAALFTDDGRLEGPDAHSHSGADGVRAALADLGAAGPGALREWALTTPLVWVDQRAVAARALFLVVGAQSTPRPDAPPTAEWLYAALDVSLRAVAEGDWRIDELRIVPRFTTPYDLDWVSAARAALAEGRPVHGYRPDKVATVDPALPPVVVLETLDAAELADPDVAELHRRVTRLEDRWAIENLMSIHEYLHAGNANAAEFEMCFAHQLADVAFEPEDWGVWDGPAAIKACYVDGAPPAAPGILTEHTTTTPVVEIAEDGRSARGVWISPGHEAFAGADGDDRVVWSWGRYGVDFAKIDGQWRFRRFHIYTTFRNDFAVDWVAASIAPRTIEFAEGEVPPGMEPPTRGVTANAPYRPDRAPRLLPAAPEPYRTFDDRHTYITPAH